MRKKPILPLILIVFLTALITLALQTVPALESLELKTIDWRFAWRGVEAVDDVPVVIVAIDDQSFESLPNRWPWPRSYYAHVVDNLTRAGAKAIGLDLIFDISDPYGARGDTELAKAIRRSGKVVLTGKMEERSSVGQISSYTYEVTPIKKLLEADSSWGVAAIQGDNDGIYRRYYVARQGRRGWRPSVAVQLLRKYENISPKVKPEYHQDYFQFGKFHIPLYDQSAMLLDFAGPAGTFPYYSFDSVIDDASFKLKGDFDLNYFDELLKDGVFKDKIVLIGSTVAELHDNFPTPFLVYKGPNGYRKAEMPGVELHANAIRTILTGKYYHASKMLVSILVLLLLIVIVMIISLRFSTVLGISITVGVLVLYLLGAFLLFSGQQWVVKMVQPTMGVFLSFVATYVFRYVHTQREKQAVMGAFQHYVPSKVVDELLQNPEKLKLGGEERFMTVMFTDIASFTTISEKLTPEKLVTLINEYLSEMTNIVLKYEGIIDKYEGDAIMAEFGAPVILEDHALRTCLAGLDMQKRLAQLAEKWRKSGKPVLRCRIGINSGNMIVGNMGSGKVFDYTVIGDEVNLASRLEGANKIFGTHLMISESTYNIVKKHVITRPLDLIRVKGRNEPVQVFEVLARREDNIEESLKNTLPVYTNGIRFFRKRQWEQALECFQYCLRLRADDGPSKLYLKRIQEYMKVPPPEDWDGVFTLQSK